MRSVLLVSVLVLAALAAAQLDDPSLVPEDSQTVFIDDEDEVTPPWETVLEGSTGGGNGGAEAPHISEVEAEDVVPASGGRATQQQDHEHGNRTAKDMDSYAAIVEGFETRLNDWCCAVTGKPLFSVSGDKDVINYMFFYLSQSFDHEGQQYGGRLVLNYHLGRDSAGSVSAPSCAMIEMGSEGSYSAPVEALLALREGLNAWLKGNEVDPDPIVPAFVANAKQMLGKFVRSRMLFAKLDGVEIPNLDQAVEKSLPLVDANDLAEYCIAGGDYMSLAPNARGVAKNEIETMVESCVSNGKLAENPTEFGEVLLEAGRVEEARALFELAVERGQLCNAFQRPDGHLRKDIVARPVWAPSQLGGTAKAMDALHAAGSPAGPAVAALIGQEDSWDVAGERTDEFARFPVFARGGVNETLCDAFGVKGCEAFADAARAIQLSNDGYEMACNGSLTIEFWAIRGGTKVPRAVGATNIVLQMLYPLSLPSGTLTVVVGEDTAQLQPGAKGPLVFDDSFETSYSIGGTEDQINVFLQAQVCHPALHEKALDAPSNECATFDEEE